MRKFRRWVADVRMRFENKSINRDVRRTRKMLVREAGAVGGPSIERIRQIAAGACFQARIPRSMRPPWRKRSRDWWDWAKTTQTCPICERHLAGGRCPTQD